MTVTARRCRSCGSAIVRYVGVPEDRLEVVERPGVDDLSREARRRSRTPRRTARRAPRGRSAGTTPAAARAAPWRAATAAARAPPRAGGGPRYDRPAASYAWLDSRLALDLGPGLLPLAVVHAVRLAVAAVGDRRLPELDRLEVRGRRIGVVLLARALRLACPSRRTPSCSPASRRSRSPAAPAPSASRRTSSTCRRSSGAATSWRASTCRPSRSRPPSGSCPSRAPCRRCSVLVWYGHDAPIVASPFLNRSISSDASAQYFLTSGFCCLSSSTAASNCSCVSSYGSSMPSSGFVFDR